VRDGTALRSLAACHGKLKEAGAPRALDSGTPAWLASSFRSTDSMVLYVGVGGVVGSEA